MWNENRLTNMLNISYPIIQAPMAGGPTTPELVSEISNYGGLGMIGAGYLDPSQVKEQIQAVKALTNSPFGINLFVIEPPDVSEQVIQKSYEELGYFREKLHVTNSLPPLNKSLDLENYVQIAIEEGVSVCSFTFGIPPRRMISRLQENGVFVIGTATTVKEAIAIQDAGMDAVVVQGSEAGGHRATFLSPEEDAMVGTMALVPQVVDNVRIPVIASGGIMDGRGCAAAYMLGAEATQLGTVFLTTHESGAKHPHKKAIIEASEEDTVVTKAFSGKSARGIKNAFIGYMENKKDTIVPYPIQNSLTKAIRKEAGDQGNADYMSLWAGQGNRLNKVCSASEVMDEIVSRMRELL